MTHKFKINPKYYGEKEKLYDKTEIELIDGLTVLIGCNGSGKSTLLQQIETQLEEEGIPVFSYDDRRSGGDSALQRMLHDDVIGLARAVQSSEGERIIQNMEYTIQQMGQFTTKNNKSKELFFLFDSIDSGLSIDNIIELKSTFHFIIEHCRKSGIACYIIVAANQYEFTKNGPGDNNMTFSFHVTKCDYVYFVNELDYNTTIIESRKHKDRRYGREEFNFQPYKRC